MGCGCYMGCMNLFYETDKELTEAWSVWVCILV